MSLNTMEAWEKRYSLRRSKLVRDALHEWWKAVLQTIRPTVAEGELLFLDKESYIRIYLIVCAALAITAPIAAASSWPRHCSTASSSRTPCCATSSRRRTRRSGRSTLMTPCGEVRATAACG